MCWPLLFNTVQAPQEILNLSRRRRIGLIENIERDVLQTAEAEDALDDLRLNRR